MASAVLFREAPLGTHGAMADRCECVFDDVRCAIDRSDKFLFALGRAPDDDQRSRLLQRTRSSDQSSATCASSNSPVEVPLR